MLKKAISLRWWVDGGKWDSEASVSTFRTEFVQLDYHLPRQVSAIVAAERRGSRVFNVMLTMFGPFLVPSRIFSLMFAARPQLGVVGFTLNSRLEHGGLGVIRAKPTSLLAYIEQT